MKSHNVLNYSEPKGICHDCVIPLRKVGMGASEILNLVVVCHMYDETYFPTSGEG